MTLGWIIAASIVGGVLSAGAAAVALLVRLSWVPMLVSFAIGTLLGAAFLEVIPHAFEQGDAHVAAAAILGGILGFFLLEKLLLWRHSHEEHEPGHDQGRSGTMIVVGDTIHNFLDGVLIAAAFLQGTELGIITAVAIVAHEIPQEVGDFIILLNSGYSRARALSLNVLSSCGTLIGGVLGYYALQVFVRWEPVLLGIVAASMIYVAVADLIPGLHRRPELRATVSQTVLIAAGIAAIALVRVVLGAVH
ncbi:MAG: ZIP zinc transporter [Betaproteobacteria bacterium RIFCSPLOWO2_02_FULL_67_19]|nr:MAG: ZIP zinc transporter [Betaproteobacteria bacterium RIFCSPLOWO2_02_FULL_67_19]